MITSPTPDRVPGTARLASLAAAIAAGLVAAVLIAPAAMASTAAPASATREHGLAGWHVAAPRSSTSLVARGQITVPSPHCGTAVRTFSPGISEQYQAGNAARTVSVHLSLECFAGLPVYGDAVLVAGRRNKNIHHPLKPGARVYITIAVRGSGVSAQIAYSRRSHASLNAAGGRPVNAEFDVALPNPPHYSPIQFSRCTINKKPLRRYKPSSWESVNHSGQVNGRVSRLSHGTSFTVTY